VWESPHRPAFSGDEDSDDKPLNAQRELEALAESDHGNRAIVDQKQRTAAAATTWAKVSRQSVERPICST
jgi:hypothetical protein